MGRGDRSRSHPAPNPKPLEMLVMHNCYVPAIAAASTLLIYPPLNKSGAPTTKGISVDGTLARADLHRDSVGATGGGESLTLGSTRIVTIPEWMDPIATASGAGHRSIPVAAIGHGPGGAVRLI